MDEKTAATVATALAVTRLRALRMAVLSLHKALVDVERARYERAKGRIESPQQALRLLMHDPWFAWLKPLSDLIVHADERLASEVPVGPLDVKVFTDHLARLLQVQPDEDDTFLDSYRRALQDAPDVIMAHARVVALLGSRQPPTPSPH